MSDFFKELSEIATTRYFSVLFRNLQNGYRHESIQVINGVMYIGNHCSINLNKFNNYTEAYIEIVREINRNIVKRENWSNIKKNIKSHLIKKYIDKNKEMYNLSENQHRNLKSYLNIILFTTDANNIVSVVNDEIEYIKGLRCEGDCFYVEGFKFTVLSKNTNVKKKINPNIKKTNKKNNDFMQNYIRKFNSCN